MSNRDAPASPGFASSGTMLGVQVSDLRCCVWLDRVVRVLYLMELQCIPRAPESVKGVFSLHGESVLVVDLAERLGIAGPERYTVDTPILLCRGAERTAGLILDEVPALVRVDERGLHMTAEVGTEGSPFAGVVNTSAGLGLVLDLDRILDLDCHGSVDVRHTERAAMLTDALAACTVDDAGEDRS